MTITELYHNGEMSYKYFRVIGGFCRFAERWERHAGLSSSVFDVDSTPFRLSLYLIVSVIVLLSGALSYCQGHCPIVRKIFSRLFVIERHWYIYQEWSMCLRNVTSEQTFIHWLKLGIEIKMNDEIQLSSLPESKGNNERKKLLVSFARIRN